MEMKTLLFVSLLVWYSGPLWPCNETVLVFFTCPAYTSWSLNLWSPGFSSELELSRILLVLKAFKWSVAAHVHRPAHGSRLQQIFQFILSKHLLFTSRVTYVTGGYCFPWRLWVHQSSVTPSQTVECACIYIVVPKANCWCLNTFLTT